MAPTGADEPADLTRPFTDAVAKAEQLIAGADFISGEQDLLEGYEYLAGSIRSSLQMAFEYDLEHPVLINPTHQYARQGLDNPDAIYFNAYLADGAAYILHGRRGTTTDLSFQVMDGTYSTDGAPGTVAAFDDRELEIDADGSFEVHFGSAREDAPANFFALGPGAATLIVREVFDDWGTEEPGRLWLERTDTLGGPRLPLTRAGVAKRYAVAAKMLLGRLETWFAFPHWFTYKEPVNTLTAPAVTPGGLASQFSSIGHYELEDDQALVVTVPVSECAYQAIQVGSQWYISTDYEHHQTSLSKAQSHADPDGMFRYVVSARNPGIANWLETTGHRRGVMMLRWQRLSRSLGPEDGPQVELMAYDDLAGRVPYFAENQIDADTRTARIAARQQGIARRMIS